MEAVRCKLGPARLGQMVPMGRAGQPMALAAVAPFLASGKSSFTTGAGIVVAGDRIDL